MSTTPAVDAIGKLHFEGNVIPTSWFGHLKHNGGKPNLTAIIILSDIVYWYRPTLVRDESTGQIVEVRKKFRSDKLQKSYQAWADQFGFTKRQVQEAVKLLARNGIITIEYRTIDTAAGPLHNVTFFEPVPEAIERITYRYEMQNGTPTPPESDTPHDGMEGVIHSNVTPPTLECNTCTDTTAQTTTNTPPPQHEKLSEEQAVELFNSLESPVWSKSPSEQSHELLTAGMDWGWESEIVRNWTRTDVGQRQMQAVGQILHSEGLKPQNWSKSETTRWTSELCDLYLAAGGDLEMIQKVVHKKLRENDLAGDGGLTLYYPRSFKTFVLAEKGRRERGIVPSEPPAPILTTVDSELALLAQRMEGSHGLAGAQ